MSYPVYIGKRIGERGIVWSEHGEVLGKAFAHSRVMAGTNGIRGPFYTAVVSTGAGFTGTSLGTRHKTRASAVRAIRMFWDWYETEGFMVPGVRRYYGPTGWESVAQKYKQSYPDVCALSARKVG
jgi:hypothetical protein